MSEAMRLNDPPKAWEQPPAWKTAQFMGPIEVKMTAKGRGWFAKTDILPGTLVLMEVPFIKWPASVDVTKDYSNEPGCQSLKAFVSQPHVAACVKEMAYMFPVTLDEVPQTEEFKAVGATVHEKIKQMLSDCKVTAVTSEDILRIWWAIRLNGFGTGFYLNVSLFNHSCQPNCVKFSPETSAGASEVRAVRPIAAGEELFISYLTPLEQSRAARQHQLTLQYCFRCDCPLCLDQVPYLESVRCVEETGENEERCEGEVKLATEKCNVCEAEATHLQAVATDIRSTEDRLMQISGAVMTGTDPSTFLKELQSLQAAALAHLHPRHIVLCRINKLLVDAVAASLQSPSANFRELLVQYLRTALDVRKTQVLYLSKDHTDLATTFCDLSNALEALLEQDPRLLFAEFPEWGTLDKARLAHAQFNRAFNRVRDLYE